MTRYLDSAPKLAQSATRNSALPVHILWSQGIDCGELWKIDPMGFSSAFAIANPFLAMQVHGKPENRRLARVCH
jgi:hypothetical protein